MNLEDQLLLRSVPNILVHTVQFYSKIKLMGVTLLLTVVGASNFSDATRGICGCFLSLETSVQKLECTNRTTNLASTEQLQLCKGTTKYTLQLCGNADCNPRSQCTSFPIIFSQYLYYRLYSD